MEPSNSGSTAVDLQIKKRTFLDEEIQLKKIDTDLSRASKKAIEVLSAMLESVDVKTRMQAAIKLLEFGIDVKKAISHDQMQRLIAEIKLNGGSNTKELELQQAGASKRPIVNFSEIRSVE